MADPFNENEVEKVLREVVTPSTWEKMSRKAARCELEKRLSLEEDALKSRRKEINLILDKIVDELNVKEEEAGSESSDATVEESEASDEEPSQKKPKSSGPDPPKNLKKLQSNMMTRNDFLKKAPQLKTRIGEKLQFEMAPRKFSSGSCGWFFGSKVELDVDGQSVWCQLGINCIVLGSKEWEDSKKRKK